MVRSSEVRDPTPLGVPERTRAVTSAPHAPERKPAARAERTGRPDPGNRRRRAWETTRESVPWGFPSRFGSHLGNGRVGWRAGTPSHPFHPVSHRPFGSHLGTLDSLHARRSELPVAGRALGVRNPGTRSELRADRVQPSRRGGPGCEPGRSEAREPGRAAWAVRGAPHGADRRVRASERTRMALKRLMGNRMEWSGRVLGRLVPDGCVPT